MSISELHQRLGRSQTAGNVGTEHFAELHVQRVLGVNDGCEALLDFIGCLKMATSAKYQRLPWSTPSSERHSQPLGLDAPALAKLILNLSG